MESIKFKLDAFEGPLDLLLHLVSKHKMNICDIEISLLLEQYLEYINGIEDLDYEIAADFFEMAARLIYIKTCYLLPRPEEAEELKKELQGRMIEYSLCKLAAQRLRDGYAGGTVFVREPVKLPVNKQYTRLHDKQELYDAYMAIYSKVKNYTPLRANMFSPIVSKRIVSVESKITYVLERLYTVGRFEMSSLYEGMTDRSERIATFLAVLELTKSGSICLNEDNTVITLRTDKPEDDEEEAPGESVPEPESSEPLEESEPVPEPEIETDTAVPELPEEPEPVPEPEIETDTAEPERPEEPEPVPEPEVDTVTTETELPEEPEPVPEPEDKPRPKRYSARLALETHTVSLRLPEIKAVPAYAPVIEPEKSVTEPEKPEPRPAETVAEPVSEETSETPAEEAPETAFKANYFGRRYYWGNAPLSLGEKNYRAAVLLRK